MKSCGSENTIIGGYFGTVFGWSWDEVGVFLGFFDVFLPLGISFIGLFWGFSFDGLVLVGGFFFDSL